MFAQRIQGIEVSEVILVIASDTKLLSALNAPAARCSNAVSIRDVFEASKQKRFSDALDVIDQLETAGSDMADLSVIKARVLRNMQCFQSARSILEASLKRIPVNEDARLMLGDTLRSLNEFDAAFDVLSDGGDASHAVARLKLMIEYGDVHATLAFGQMASARWPNDMTLQVLCAQTFVRDLQADKAVQLLDSALGRDPASHAVRHARIDLALRQNDLDAARTMLVTTTDGLASLQLWQRLDGLSGSASDATDARIVQRVKAIHDAAPSTGLTHRAHLELGDLFFLKGDWKQALEHFRSSGANTGRNRARAMKMARCHYRLLNFEACRRALERILKQNARSRDALVLRSTLDLIEGRIDEHFAQLTGQFNTVSHRQVFDGVRLFRSYMRIGDAASAGSVLKRMAGLSEKVFEPEYVNCLVDFNHVQAAVAYCRHWAKDAADSRLHEDIFQTVEGLGGVSFGVEWNQPLQGHEAVGGARRKRELRELQALGNGKAPDANGLPVPISLNVAHRICADDTVPFATWQRRARTATQVIRKASHLGLSQQDIAAFAKIPDRSVLGEYAETQQPLVLVTSHCGPPVCSALDTNILVGRKLAYLRTQAVQDRQKERLIEVGHDPQKAAVALVKAVSSGTTISLAVDSPVLWQSGGRYDSGARGMIFGVPVTISASPLKLCHAFNAPMFWIQALWVKGRIEFQIEQMDLPSKHMPFQQAADLWAQSYLKRVEMVMKSGPENQDLSAPMWQHLTYSGGERL